MGSYEHGWDDILDKVQVETGLRFTIWNSGGHCMIFEARLETGQFLWVTDYDADIEPLASRHEIEAAGGTVGLQVSVLAAMESPQRYADVIGGTVDTVPDDWANVVDSNRCLASVRHGTAKAEQMPELVALAILSLPRNAHHHIDQVETVHDDNAGHGRQCKAPYDCWTTIRHPGEHITIYGIDEY